MSAIDIIRSFAESTEPDDAKATVIITRGGLRELVLMHEAAERIIAAQPEALALLGAKMADKDAENASLHERLRTTAQILIAEVGANGPMDAEDAARKAVTKIEHLRELLRGCVEGWQHGDDVYGPMQAAMDDVLNG